MKRISSSEAKRISELRSTLGDRTLRQLLTQEDKRLIRPERLAHLESGSGKLSESEARQLKAISKNSTLLKNLKAKAKEKREFKVNRSLRIWLNQGKAKDEPIQEQETKDKVVRALGFLGVDPTDGTYYVRKGQ